MTQDENYWVNRPINDEDRDWKTNGENWVEDYVLSKDHPHRKLILDFVELSKPASILEFGCNTAPNLALIHEKFPEIKLAGFDISDPAITRGKEVLPEADLKLGSYYHIPFEGHFDLGICDASLMYIPPEDIAPVLEDVAALCKDLVIVERVSEEEDENGYIWSRNYPKILKEMGFEVSSTKLTEETWPHSRGWQEKGFVILAKRDAIQEKSS